MHELISEGVIKFDSRTEANEERKVVEVKEKEEKKEAKKEVKVEKVDEKKSDSGDEGLLDIFG